MKGAQDMTNTPLLLLDSAGCDMAEEEAGEEEEEKRRRRRRVMEKGGSRRNVGEAEVVCAHVKALMAVGVKEEDIAVITPYNAQVGGGGAGSGGGRGEEEEEKVVALLGFTPWTDAV